MLKIGPKKGDHPSVGELCPACHVALKEGDFTTLIPLGPGDDPEVQQRASEGRVYNTIAVEVHYNCAGGRWGW